jgi:hypothetical protein
MEHFLTLFWEWFPEKLLVIITDITAMWVRNDMTSKNNTQISHKFLRRPRTGITQQDFIFASKQFLLNFFSVYIFWVRVKSPKSERS